MMSLSTEERQRFAAWLRADAESNLALCEQLEKLNVPMKEQLILRHKLEASAESLIARKLENTETWG